MRFFRKYHKWFSLVATLFILFFAVSGIILNHRELLSGIDVKRKWLPENYRYKSWNLASVKGSLEAGPDSVLIFGNIGVWLTDRSFKKFHDFNPGFPAGIDNRKISSMAKAPGAGLYAGTLFGLYRMNGDRWARVELPVDESRIVKVISKGDSLMVMTRSHLLFATAGDSFRTFSGIFEWEPSAERITDYITKTAYVDTGRGGPPFGSVSVAGYLKSGSKSELIFDYANGVFPISGTNPLPLVPREIISQSPISLWNMSLEVHTGRIFQPILGPFYILVVPLVGLTTLIILISGFFAWWLPRRNVQWEHRPFSSVYRSM